MSRGVGSVQKRILEYLADTQTPRTFEALRWKLWDGDRRKAGRLPQSWNTSVGRAISSLVERKELTVTGRPLANLEEWVANYPGKSLNIQIYNLRSELLPHLAEWMRDGSGPFPSYTRSENEEYAAKLLSKQGKLEQLSTFWNRIHPCLRECYGKTGYEDVFLLLIRGAQLFGSLDVATPTSLGELVNRCANQNQIPAGLRDDLEGLVLLFLPKNVAGTLEFKSYIRAIARDIPTHGHCQLSDAAKDALLDRHRDLVASLPGFKPAPKPSVERSWFTLDFDRRNRPQHSPLLAKLLDHSVFHDFRFLKLRGI